MINNNLRFKCLKEDVVDKPLSDLIFLNKLSVDRPLIKHLNTIDLLVQFAIKINFYFKPKKILNINFLCCSLKELPTYVGSRRHQILEISDARWPNQTAKEPKMVITNITARLKNCLVELDNQFISQPLQNPQKIPIPSRFFFKKPDNGWLLLGKKFYRNKEIPPTICPFGFEISSTLI